MELIPVEEVAKELHTAHRAVVKAILNGTLPIGMATEPEDGGRYIARIPKERWEKWKKGNL